MRCSRIVGSLLCFAVAAVTALAGQQRDSSLAGLPARVMPRCDVPGSHCNAVVGTLVRMDSDSLTLRTVNNVERRFAWPAVRTVDVSHHTRGHLGNGLLVGLGLGIVGGEVMKSSCASSAGEDAGLCMLWFVITVPVGTILGGVVGASIRSPTWEPMALPAQGAVLPGHRVGLALRAPW